MEGCEIVNLVELTHDDERLWSQDTEFIDQLSDCRLLKEQVI
jgi:hypothetical protein